MGKGIEIEIGGVHIDIKPMTVSSLPLLMKVGQEGNPEEQAEAMQEILRRTLKDSIPDATDEEIGNISLEHLTKIMEKIMEVNQLEGMDTHKQKFLEDLKKKNERSGTTGNTKG